MISKSSFFTVFIAMIILVGCSGSDLPIAGKAQWQKLATGLAFPEGPAILQEDVVYFSNCNGGWIGKYANGKLDTFLVAEDRLWQKTNGMTFHRGTLYACEYGFGKILQISPTGKMQDYVKNYRGKRFNRPNDLTFDDQGNLYFTDPKSYGAKKLDGRVFMVNGKDRSVILLQDSLAFPNGIGISPLDNKLYVCESAKNRILSFDIKSDGRIENMQEFIELPGGDPDGINFDSHGNLYVAHFGTGKLFVISPAGEIIQEIATPGERPTNVEFGGKKKRTLYLTETETNALYSIPVNIKGL